jgi:uncharacterized glyoxalase superfamily protein PhnB
MINAITANIITSDLQKSYQFYGEKLWFPLLFSVNNEWKTEQKVDENTVFVEFGNDNFLLMIQDEKSYKEDIWENNTFLWWTNLYIDVNNINDYIDKCEKSNIEILMWPRETFYWTKEILIKDNLWNNLILAEKVDL